MRPRYTERAEEGESAGPAAVARAGFGAERGNVGEGEVAGGVPQRGYRGLQVERV